MTEYWRKVDAQSDATELVGLSVYYRWLYNPNDKWRTPTGSRVHNIKKMQNGPHEEHRKRSINEFANDLIETLRMQKFRFSDWCIIPIPSGRGNSAVMDACHIAGANVGMDVIKLLESRTEQRDKTRARSTDLSMSEFTARFDEEMLEKTAFVLVDDVILSGSTIQACANIITSSFPNVRSGVGLVWALSRRE